MKLDERLGLRNDGDSEGGDYGNESGGVWINKSDRVEID